jgi:hypothetical protein
VIVLSNCLKADRIVEVKLLGSAHSAVINRRLVKRMKTAGGGLSDRTGTRCCGSRI